MYLVDNQKLNCYGCRACVEICPKSAIQMKEDEKGFLYPHIDETLCVNCELCKTVCPVNYPLPCDSETQNACVGVHTNTQVVEKSASGGAFSAIYRHLLPLGYIVWGVEFDENLYVRHNFAVLERDCEKFRKSKYVLSDTNGCFKKIQEQLLEGKKVLFTGTPCQCAALLNFLKTKKVSTKDLITVDIICHGAPNNQLFDLYKQQLEGKKKKRIISYKFRNKKPIDGKINSRTAEIVFEDGESLLVTQQTDSFLKGYYSRLFYRDSCGACRFAQPKRVTDITIADAWGVENIYPDLNSLSGCSLLISNSQKGEKVVEALQIEMQLRSVLLEWAVANNEQLRKPTQMHKNREVFFKALQKANFEKAVNKATKRSLLRRILGKIKRILFG